MCRDPLLSGLHESHRERMREVTSNISRGYTSHLLTSLGRPTQQIKI